MRHYQYLPISSFEKSYQLLFLILGYYAVSFNKMREKEKIRDTDEWMLKTVVYLVKKIANKNAINSE